MVVPVLITSCQLSEKWNRGPVNAQRRTTSEATRNAHGDPATSEHAIGHPHCSSSDRSGGGARLQEARERRPGLAPAARALLGSQLETLLAIEAQDHSNQRHVKPRRHSSNPVEHSGPPYLQSPPPVFDGQSRRRPLLSSLPRRDQSFQQSCCHRRALPQRSPTPGIRVAWLLRKPTRAAPSRWCRGGIG